MVESEGKTLRSRTLKNWNVILSYPSARIFGHRITYIEVFVNRVIKFISFAKRKLMQKLFFSGFVVKGKHTYYQWRNWPK